MIKESVLKVTVVTFEEMEDLDFIPPSTFFYKDALGNFNYIHTSKRDAAQAYVDEVTGVKNKYVVIASKLQKTKSKQESGGYSAR